MINNLKELVERVKKEYNERLKCKILFSDYKEEKKRNIAKLSFLSQWLEEISSDVSDVNGALERAGLIKKIFELEDFKKAKELEKRGRTDEMFCCLKKLYSNNEYMYLSKKTHILIEEYAQPSFYLNTEAAELQKCQTFLTDSVELLNDIIKE